MGTKTNAGGRLACMTLGVTMAISCGSSVSHQTTETLPGLTAEQITQVEKTVSEQVTAQGYPSLAVGIIKDGRLVWQKGYGSRSSSGGSVGGDTVFRIGSITKVFTAVSIMQLRDSGKLRLDDPAAKYLPEAAKTLSPAGSTPVTVMHLVSHSSGVPTLGDGSLDWTTGDHDITEAELLKAVQDIKLDFPPGSRFEYSNVGMALAGLIVARASGQPYREYVNEHILRPLGMTSSFWDRGSIPAERLAEGHWRKPAGGYEPGGPHWRLGAVEPAGGLYSTIGDMARFAAFALRRPVLAQSGAAQFSVLKTDSLHEMQRPALEISGAMPHGMGWVVEKSPVLGPLVWHNGSTHDYGAWLGVAPEKGIAFVGLLSSGDLSDVDELATLGKDVLESLVVDPATRAATKKTPTEATDAAMARVIKLLAKPDESLAQETFSPEFLAKLPMSKLLPFFKTVGTQTGVCNDYKITRDRGDGEFRAHLRCASANLNADIKVRILSPFLIDGIAIKPAS